MQAEQHAKVHGSSYDTEAVQTQQVMVATASKSAIDHH